MKKILHGQFSDEGTRRLCGFLLVQDGGGPSIMIPLHDIKETFKR
jgi:hypothetical protein